MRAAQEARAALELAHGDEALEHLALEALGSALWSRGEVHQAAVVLGSAHRLRERTGRAMHGPLDELARSSPGWDQGRHLGVTDVLTYLTEEADAQRRPTAGWGSLTEAELRVVELAADGLSNPGIAQRLYISPNTVKTHLLRSYRKLGVRSRRELSRVRR